MPSDESKRETKSGTDDKKKSGGGGGGGSSSSSKPKPKSDKDDTYSSSTTCRSRDKKHTCTSHCTGCGTAEYETERYG